MGKTVFFKIRLILGRLVRFKGMDQSQWVFGEQFDLIGFTTTIIIIIMEIKLCGEQ